MERKAVERRPLAAAARLERSAEVADERRRRVRVAARAGPVDAPRRQRAAPDPHVLVRLLRRVVGSDEQRVVGGRGRVSAVGVELRHPEPVEVRLVADDHVADRGHLIDDRRDVRRELPPRLARQRGRRGSGLVDREEDAQPVGSSGDVAKDVELLGGGRGESRLPEAGDPDRAEARVAQLVERRSGLADEVVDRADDEGRTRLGRLRLRRGRGIVAAAAGERQRREEERTVNGTLERTTALPGRVACTKETVRR